MWTHAIACMWNFDGDLQGVVLFFYHVGFRDQTIFIPFSHLVSPGLELLVPRLSLPSVGIQACITSYLALLFCVCEWLACRGQKRVLNGYPKTRVVGDCEPLYGYWEQNQVLCKTNKRFEPLSHLSNPYGFIFNVWNCLAWKYFW